MHFTNVIYVNLSEIVIVTECTLCGISVCDIYYKSVVWCLTCVVIAMSLYNAQLYVHVCTSKHSYLPARSRHLESIFTTVTCILLAKNNVLFRSAVALFYSWAWYVVCNVMLI